MKTYRVVHFLTLNQGVQGSSPWRRTKELFLGTRSLGDGSFFVEKIGARQASYTNSSTEMDGSKKMT